MHLSRRILRAGAALCVASAGVVAFLPGTSSADAPTEVGYWSRPLPQEDTVEPANVSRPVVFNSPRQQVPNPGGPVTTLPSPVPPPTLPVPTPTIPDPQQPSPFGSGAPEGGFWVANDVTGAYAVSALRFAGDIGSARLTLPFAPGSTTVSNLIACPVLSQWTGEVNGAWNNRPAHDCNRLEISGRLNPEGTAMVFDLPGGFATFGSRDLQLMILPDRQSGDVFSLFFEAPGPDALEVFSANPVPDTEDPLEPIDEDTLPTTTSTTAPPAPARSGGSTSGGVTPAPAPSPTTEAPAATDEAADTEEVAIAAPAPQPVADVVAPLEAVVESRTGRIIAVVLLLGMGYGLFWLGQKPTPAPKLIGGLASAGAVAATPPVSPSNIRGIGRFRTPRDGGPTKLS